jgi:hypothetical protein
MLRFDEAWRLPGIHETVEVAEGQVWWGGDANRPVVVPVFLDGAARDNGNTPTTVLRPGLLMGIVTSTRKWKQWDPNATDGTEHIAGVLMYASQTQSNGADADRWFGYAMVRGGLKAACLIIPGSASPGINGSANELFVRALLTQSGRFILDDEFQGSPFGGWQRVVAKTANYTLVEADNNTLFTNTGATGAVTFTLPTPRLGFRCGFFVAADQNVTVTGTPANSLVVLNNASATNVVVGTAGEKVGAMLEVIQTGSKSLVIPHLWEAQTVTIS